MDKGFTVWFTGLSGSGKSTLANLIAEELGRRGRRVDILDGDVVRQHLSKGLGFSKEDRDTNIRRIGFVAHLISRHGGVAITAAISPYRVIREENRKLIGNFLEVYCRCSIEECERRDIKGLYKKAREALARGQGMKFTGVDDPYEEPLNPEVVVETDKETIAQSREKIMEALVRMSYLEGGADESAGGREHHEYLPEELIGQAERCLRRAGKIHSGILVRELHIGWPTAAKLMDALAERGRIILS